FRDSSDCNNRGVSVIQSCILFCSSSFFRYSYTTPTPTLYIYLDLFYINPPLVIFLIYPANYPFSPVQFLGPVTTAYRLDWFWPDLSPL
ncbi:uncharacterized protein EURHEDRAFT_385684, partial [Aspergillus ruber CBS 135680]